MSIQPHANEVLSRGHWRWRHLPGPSLFTSTTWSDVNRRMRARDGKCGMATISTPAPRCVFNFVSPTLERWVENGFSPTYPIVTFAYNYRIRSLREQLNTVESRYVFIPFPCWHLHVHPNSSTLAIYKFTHTNPEVTNERLHVERSVWDVWTSGKTPQNCPVQLLNLADPRKWAGPNTDLDSPCRFWLVSARKPGIEMCLLYP